ncbi:flagellar protein [Alkaliphilus metalliredigens QYMF]|uniref:Flagellar protein n=1 Tax=Alkaliphilus metalliredigens (strain QYMF) TaxID=293826 RepID=A6TL81_ALKMQ|nr:TIGR03826 family flagellar region protein [Alkaliphilus metalliredigens]ABR46949.1 flagellar protein [Alkaliphilus metalliredigens QYMF]
MDLRNCKQCGRAFSYQGMEVCSRCASDDQSEFAKVKEYLYEHPGATVSEVSDETEVSEKSILRYLRESRIEIRESDNLYLDCERCGAGIQSGKYCDSCAGEMKRQFTAAITPKTKPKEETTTESKNRMFIAERKRQK